MERNSKIDPDEAIGAGRSVTLAGVLVNIFLIILKFAAGILGHSQALIADAIHSVSDLFTDAVVLIGIKLGRKEPDEDHPFGHARIETVASAIIGVALTVTAIFLCKNAAQNIYFHNVYHPTFLAIIGAALSILSKELLYRYTVSVGRRIKSQVIIANAWHHRSDSLSSIAVLIGVAGAKINPSWHILDSVAAIVVSVLVLRIGLKILWDAIREITDTAPRPEVLGKIKSCAQGVKGVQDAHDLRVRSSGGFYQMEIHIGVDETLSVAQGHRIAKEVELCVQQEVEEISSIIVHVDPTTVVDGKEKRDNNAL